MGLSDFEKPRPDLRKLQVLVELREAANLTQDQAGALLGLEGTKRRDSVRAWETGASYPALKRRPDFIVYLLDATPPAQRSPALSPGVGRHNGRGMGLATAGRERMASVLARPGSPTGDHQFPDISVRSVGLIGRNPLAPHAAPQH